MTQWRLKGSYYGPGTPTPPELEEPEGRARMRLIIEELLAAGEAGGAPDASSQRLQDDLELLGQV